VSVPNGASVFSNGASACNAVHCSASVRRTVPAHWAAAVSVCAAWRLLRLPLPSESAPQLPSESARHGVCSFARKREVLQFLLSFDFPVLTSNTLWEC
jgi:hypothetical protein